MAEILGAPELDDQEWAAWTFGLEGCRRGLRSLERRLDELVRIVECGGDYWIGPAERKVVGELLFAIGRMDTPRSHGVLERLIRTSPSHLVRADAIDGTTWERENFDLDLVLPFVSMQATTPEILSALYALQFRYVRERGEEVRLRVASLLEHDYDMVKVYAIQCLMDDAANLDLVAPLADHPHEAVRGAVADAMRLHEDSDEPDEASS